MIVKRNAKALVIFLFAISLAEGGEMQQGAKTIACTRGAGESGETAGSAKETALRSGAGFPEFTPRINKKDELLISKGFRRGEGPSGLGEHWKIGNGKWEIQGDAVTAIKSVGEDHPAGLRSDIG